MKKKVLELLYDYIYLSHGLFQCLSYAFFSTLPKDTLVITDYEWLEGFIASESTYPSIMFKGSEWNYYFHDRFCLFVNEDGVKIDSRTHNVNSINIGYFVEYVRTVSQNKHMPKAIRTMSIQEMYELFESLEKDGFLTKVTGVDFLVVKA